MYCMSQLHTIGEGDFFVSCLLHLSPEDLKACRLVNKTWNKVIMERVWGNKRVRKRLEEKLVHRWKTTNPKTVQLVAVHGAQCMVEVKAMFCNNTHVFCGIESGEVKVYTLTDGQWVRRGFPEVAYQLVVLQEGERNWENMILESFPMPSIVPHLVVDTDWLAVAWWDESRRDIFKVKLWKEELFRQDIELPGVSACDVDDLVLESPFLVVGGHSGDSESGDRVTGWIKVFQLADDNLMEDLNSAASLIKTVQFPGFSIKKNLLCTGLVLGCLLSDKDLEFSFVLIEKTALFDAATPPEETKGT